MFIDTVNILRLCSIVTTADQLIDFGMASTVFTLLVIGQITFVLQNTLPRANIHFKMTETTPQI